MSYKVREGAKNMKNHQKWVNTFSWISTIILIVSIMSALFLLAESMIFSLGGVVFGLVQYCVIMGINCIIESVDRISSTQ